MVRWLRCYDHAIVGCYLDAVDWGVASAFCGRCSAVRCANIWYRNVAQGYSFEIGVAWRGAEEQNPFQRCVENSSRMLIKLRQSWQL